MRADNHGEGGILALLALRAAAGAGSAAARCARSSCSALFGAALLYGDGMITPAISVLSAVEGLEVATPRSRTSSCRSRSSSWSALFLVQRRGTGGDRQRVRAGHARLVRRASARSGCAAIIARTPASSPRSTRATRVAFFWRPRRARLPRARRGRPRASPAARRSTPTWATSARGRSASPGSPSCCRRCCSTTSARARCCCASPRRSTNPFYRLAPAGAALPAGRPRDRWPTVDRVAGADLGRVLAHAAGRPARLLPARDRSSTPRRTSAGQIYIPEVNCAAHARAASLLVLGFRTSTALAAAYGIAVTGTMAITSMLFSVVARAALGLAALARRAACGRSSSSSTSRSSPPTSSRSTHGGWVPLAVAAGVFTLMTTWKRGRAAVRRWPPRDSLPLDAFLEESRAQPTPPRVPGTAVFLTSTRRGRAPRAPHHFKHNKVLTSRCCSWRS